MEYREIDTDSEQESVGTNSESNDEASGHVSGDEDMQIQEIIVDISETDESLINEQSNNELNYRTRPSAPRRKISRLASAI